MTGLLKWTGKSSRIGLGLFRPRRKAAGVPAVVLSGVPGLALNAGASAYTFANNHSLSFNGAGIVINGGSATINNNIGGNIDFNNNSTAGNTAINNNYNLDFNSSVQPPTAVSAENLSAVVLEVSKNAVPAGTVAGFQLAAVLKSPDAGVSTADRQFVGSQLE